MEINMTLQAAFDHMRALSMKNFPFGLRVCCFLIDINGQIKIKINNNDYAKKRRSKK